MTTKAIITLALVLGFAQSSLASLDQSQNRNSAAVKTLQGAGSCPYKNNSSLHASTAFKKPVTNDQNVGGSESDTAIN